jgi:hypothetical protein
VQPSDVFLRLRVSPSWPIPPEQSGARSEAVHPGMESPLSGAGFYMYNVPYPAFRIVWYQSHGHSTRHR